MGCLRNIINLIIIGFAIIGFLSIGGREYLERDVMPAINRIGSNFQVQMHKRGKSFTELSLKELGEVTFEALKTGLFPKKMENGYEVTEVKGLMGYDTKIAEDLSNGQKMVIANTKDKILLDLNTDDKVELKAEMLRLAQKHKALPVKFDDIEIVELGKWKVLNQDLRYAKVSIKDANSEITAIVSSVPDETNAKIIVTFAEKSKFSRKIAEKYFKHAR